MLRRLLDALAEQWGLTGLDIAARACSPRCSPRSPPARAPSTVAVHGAHAVCRGVARLRRHRVRRRGRRRLDDRRRPPLRSRDRRGGRVGRDHEPADPVRRGPDEPRLVRDDARRAARHELTAAIRGRPRASVLAELVRRGRRRPRPTCSTSCSSAIRSCTTSCSASTRRRSAPRRSRSRPTSRSTRGPTTSTSVSRTRTCTCCRASPVTSAPTPRPPCCRKVRTAATTCMLLVDVGTNAEIVLGNRERLFAASSPTGPAFEGAQLSLRASARRPARSSGCASTATTLEPRVKVIGIDAWSRRARASRRRRPASAITGVCGSGVIEVIAELFLAGVILRDGTIDGDGRRRARRASSPTVARSRTCCTTRPAGELRDHPERRARDPARQGRAQRGRAPADGPRRRSRGFDTVRLAGAFGNHIDPGVRDRARPDPRRATRRSRATSATRPAAARCARCCRRPHATRSPSVARRIVKIETAIEPRVPGAVRARDGLPRTPTTPRRTPAPRRRCPSAETQPAMTDADEDGTRSSRTAARAAPAAAAGAAGRARSRPTSRRRRSSPAR